jgi:hypothetical protein
MEILLSELVDQDLIRLYFVQDERFIFIPRFKQRLRYYNSKYPEPPIQINDIDYKKTDSSLTQVIPKTDPSLLKRSEVKRSEENIHTYTEDFELFWKSYPRHEAKSLAMKAFKKVKVDINILLQAIAKQKNSKQWKDNIIPHASTWLNQSRWEDEIITKPTNDIFSPVRNFG